jgi:hypothetical protein
VSDLTGAAAQAVDDRKAASKTRSDMRRGTSRVTGREDLTQKNDDGPKRPGSFAPLRWLRTKLSRAVGQVRARVKDSAGSVIRSLLPRAVGWVRRKTGSPVRLIKSVFMATIGKDRGFAFWWLVVTTAIAVTIGLLVAALLSPVIGILAALVVGIWMLIRRSRSSRSRRAGQAHLAS